MTLIENNLLSYLSIFLYKTSCAPMLRQMDKSLTVPAFVMTVLDTEDENMDPEGMVIGPPSSKMSVDGKPSAKISSTSVSTNASKFLKKNH